MNKRITFLFLLLLITCITTYAKSPDHEPVFIGINVESIDADSTQQNSVLGLKVTGVTQHSPADLAGFKVNWIILSVNGKKLTDGDGIQTLKNVLKTCRHKEETIWTIIDHESKTKKVSLTPISKKQWSLDSTRRLARNIAQDVESMRELKSKKKIDINVMDRNQLHTFLKDDFQKELIEADLKKGELILSRLGLQPEGIDTVAITLELLKSGVFGFYHPKTKQLILIEGQSGITAESTMAHELTHALQDHYFPLEFMLQQLRKNSDMGSALRCVTEGDAKLLELEYIKKIQQGNQDDLWLKEELPGGNFVPPNLDPRTRYFMNLEKELMFPYRTGARFVKEAWRRGGWDAVNRLYDDWPKSTEQIIHFEKYFDKREDPIKINSHDFIDWADQDYEVMISDVMGELNTIRLFLNFVNRKVIDAENVGAGWDGDRLIGLINKKTKKPVIVWMSLWETEKDANEFADALTLIYQNRFTENADQRSDEIVAIDGDIVTIIKRQGKKVLFCDGANKQEALKILEQTVRGSEIVTSQKNIFWEKNSR